MEPSLRDLSLQIYYDPADDPLHSFFTPALSASVRYDRSAGFFSSSALAVAAEGVAHLIGNGGKMRLLVGALLGEKDIDAIRRGYDIQDRLAEGLLERFPDPQEALLQKRLEVLAWMVAEESLRIKVVLPRDEQGSPIPASRSTDYYHPKSGIFTDAHGNQVAFSGSINESAAGWQNNYESFAVFTSWSEGQAYVPHIARRFEALWSNLDPNWIALDIPLAVQEKLLRFRPASAPARDPLELPTQATGAGKPPRPDEIPADERILFQFLRDAPLLPSALTLGEATAAVSPWPHQSQVGRAVLKRFPDRAMLCDEVGLGKTIEAGLVIRQLILSHRVRRCLILAPKSVLRQWQEELYEKFSLEIPRYDAGKLIDPHGQAKPVPVGGLWEVEDVLLVSSQLAKRSDRREDILAARGWDLLVVDEAHHARRKDFKDPRYRPNQLLSLLNQLNEKGKISGLLLMTATPMQVHPVEVWDLLSTLGLGGRWGADKENFLTFFRELRRPFEQVDWDFVFDLVADFLKSGGQLQPAFQTQADAELGPVKRATLFELPGASGARAHKIASLGESGQRFIWEMARLHTPLNHFAFRITRELLREYQKRGLLKEKVPARRPERRRIPMRSEESRLYDRIEEYIANFYHKYEKERRGLGFVMTVYRRRLTSSFYAIRRSLERRLDFLLGKVQLESTLDDDDVEQDELDFDVLEQLEGSIDRQLFKAEQEYVEDFLHELRSLGGADSKIEALKEELNRVFRQRGTVLVFTQYTDTMDYLREQLKEVYGSSVACYSGRGGEIWNGTTWELTSKENVKTRFKEGELRILLCTESASEGLNLQTCGVLINYDMPWNPMRVEQRIGRIDRIGQQFDEVWIYNYFYLDTIEDRIYERLADRIAWFEVVVGDLQPILAEVSAATQRLALLPAEQRKKELDDEIRRLRRHLETHQIDVLNLDQWLQPDERPLSDPSPVFLPQLEKLLTTSRATAHLFREHPEIEHAYLLDWQGRSFPVTFSPESFDRHPSTVLFLSYGNPLLPEILSRVPPPEPDGEKGLIRCEVAGDLDLCGWYASLSPGERPQPVESLHALEQVLGGDRVRPSGEQKEMSLAGKHFEQEIRKIRAKNRTVLENRRKARALSLRAQAQRLLQQAALIEVALGRQADMFEDQTYPIAFNEQAIRGLTRHGFPWTALNKLAFETGLSIHEDDPFYQEHADAPRDSLKGRFSQMAKDARELVADLSGYQSTEMAEEKDVVEGEINVQAF